ncbi:Ff.00g039750.m01.CDS01 [Fusarium sp. VM40]|nr:Ff.00g039750.m01.CDS01 [Fusarium sp. VM40]
MSSATMTEDPTSPTPSRRGPKSPRPSKPSRTIGFCCHNSKRMKTDHELRQPFIGVLDGHGDKHYTLHKCYQDASARIGNLPAYHLKANKAAIATFEQSLAQAKEAVTSTTEKFKENWARYHATGDELLGALASGRQGI